MHWYLLKNSLVGVLATLFCIWLLRPLACHIGFVDSPGGRKHHSHDVPLIGGIAIFFGFCFALLSSHTSLIAFRDLIAGSALVVLMGIVDDFKELSSRLRLFGQLLAALLIIVWGRHVITNLGDIFLLGPVHLGLLGLPFTCLVVVTYLNAMNMLDGQDGLAASVSLGQAALLAYLAYQLHLYVATTLLYYLALMLVVFLYFNLRWPWRRRASIFMGDHGATFIGFVLIRFGIHISQVDVHVVQPMTVAWIIALPFFDLMHVVIYRLRMRRSPLRAGRDHLHHLLHARGLGAMQSTALILAISLSFGVIGLLLNHWRVPASWQFLAFISCLVVYLVILQRLKYKLEQPVSVGSPA